MAVYSLAASMKMVAEYLTTEASQVAQVNVHNLVTKTALVEVAAATLCLVAIPWAHEELAVGLLLGADSMMSLVGQDGDRLGVIYFVVLLLILLLELHRPR